ncbi:MAG: helix-turn-helix domain-containing protein [Thermoanaerobaculia bacterium]
MRESKKKRLEKKGWKIGSAADFLELTPEESAYIEVKIRLSQALRELRRKATLTQTELAHRLRSSQSRVAKMEAGDPSVSIDLLTRSLIALGASPKDIARAISGRA